MVFVSKSRWNSGKWEKDTVIIQKIKMQSNVIQNRESFQDCGFPFWTVDYMRNVFIG